MTMDNGLEMKEKVALPADSNSDSAGEGNGTPRVERGHWASKWEFFLSCVGLSVGIGNVWRFPSLAFSNGGGAFLVPYIILLVLVGKPMYYMEVALGQFSQLGPVAVWNMSPIFTGVGLGMTILSLNVAIYYNVIMSYAVFYTVASMAPELPWNRCQEWWGADQYCYTRGYQDNDTLTYYDIGEGVLYFNGSRVCNQKNLTLPCVNVTLQTAARQYWEKYVLGLKPDGLSVLGDIGSIQWQLLLAFSFSWILVFLCAMKGVKSSGKVVYVTATLPYVVLIVFLVYGITLNGSLEGIKYFFIPDWNKLTDLQVWRKAAEQMFYSLSISWGGLIMFGSYNHFRHRVHVDALVVSSLDFLTSIIAGIATFSIMGTISSELGVDIQEVAITGPGFAFVTFPEAINRLPIPQFWAVLFFIMLITLALDTQFALIEIILSTFYDKFPVLRKYKVYATLAVCCLLYLLGLPCVSQAGNYVIDIMDTFGGGTGIFLLAIFEMIGIMWCYGVGRFSRDIHFMLGVKPNWYWRICWICAPIILTAIFILAMITFRNPVMGDRPYPEWAISIGWCLLATIVLPIPVTAVFYLFQFRKNGEWQRALEPTEDWGPGDVTLREEWLHFQSESQPEPLHSLGYDNPAMNVEE